MVILELKILVEISLHYFLLMISLDLPELSFLHQRMKVAFKKFVHIIKNEKY